MTYYQENTLPSAVNVLKNSPRILDFNKKDTFQLNFIQSHEIIWWKCCGAVFGIV